MSVADRSLPHLPATAFAWVVIAGLVVEAGWLTWVRATVALENASVPSVFASADDAVRFGLGPAAPALDAVREHTDWGDLVIHAVPPGFMLPLFIHIQPRLSAFLPADRRVDPRVWTATTGAVWYLDLGTGLSLEHESRERVAGADSWSLWRLSR